MSYNVKESARHVLSCAPAEVVRLRPAHLGPDHIPLGLPRHGDGVGGALLALWCFLCAPSAGVAQRLPERLPSVRPPAADSARVFAPTYWYEGATIGAALLGATTLIMAAGFCDFNDGGSCTPVTYVGSAALGGVVGAGLGGLVGGMFDAPHARPLRGQPGRAALLGAVGGAVWSVGFLCHTVARCSGRGEATFGLSMSLIGAVAGLIVGR